jgi:hypothetical protein
LVVWGWAWHFGKIIVHHPHFLRLAPTLGKVKASIPHGAWRFKFLKYLDYTWTFISTVEISSTEIVNSLKIPQELLV